MRIKEAAIRLLARREHSRRELAQKLLMRGFEPSEVNPLLDELEQDNFLSDARFVGMIVRTRSQRGVGPLKILAELQKHGISSKMVEQDEDWQSIDWVQVGCLATVKRFGEEKHVSQERQSLLKQKRFLSQRGFQQEFISEILNYKYDDISKK